MRIVDSLLIVHHNRLGDAMLCVIVIRDHAQQVPLIGSGCAPVDEECFIDLSRIDGQWSVFGGVRT